MVAPAAERGPGSLRRLARRWRLVAVPALSLVAWSLLSELRVFPEYALPSLAQVLSTSAEQMLSGEIFVDLAASLARVVAGAALATALGIPLGLLIGSRASVGELAELPIHGARPIPPLAWVPFALIWFGGGFGSSVFLVFLGAFFPIVLDTVGGARAVDRGHLDVARTLGLNGFLLVRKVLIPSALPFMLTGVRVGVGVAWMTVVAAEFFGQAHGLGARIMESYNLLRMDVVVVAMLFLGVGGLAVDLVLRLASRRIIRWRVL